MVIISQSRNSGKTEELIRISATTGHTIVCPNWDARKSII